MEAVAAGASDPLVDRLVEPALRFAVDAAEVLPLDTANRPTPCDPWTVGEVADHLLESLGCLTAALDVGFFPARSESGCHPRDLAGFRELLELATAGLLAAARRCTRAPTSVDGVELDRRSVLVVASIEASIHSWDVLAGAGVRQPIPGPVARNLHLVVPTVVNPTTRGEAFAAPVTLPGPAGASDQVLAALGRSPSWCSTATESRSV
jgi:uncharacterized protein (TIGR03086 family)